MSEILWRAKHPLAALTPPAYAGDAGFDLAAVQQVVLPGLDQPVTEQGDHYPVRLIPCGLQLALPDDMCAVIVGRSNTHAHGLLVLSTVIDAGYRGDIFVMAVNLNRSSMVVLPGQRVAQLVPLPLMAARLGLRRVDELPPSARGENGFGSSGGGISHARIPDVER